MCPSNPPNKHPDLVKKLVDEDGFGFSVRSLVLGGSFTRRFWGILLHLFGFRSCLWFLIVTLTILFGIL